MKKRTTTVRMPDQLAEKADVVARGRGIGVEPAIPSGLIRPQDHFDPEYRHREGGMTGGARAPASRQEVCTWCNRLEGSATPLR